MNRHTAFSIVLLALVFSAGFSIAYFFKPSSWSCPACSFNSADAITPIVNDQFFDIAYENLQNARGEIDIVMYEMKLYETNNSVHRLEDLLIKKAGEGIPVKVVLDQSEWQGKITSLTKDNQKTAEYLKNGGVEVKFDPLKTTTHDKLIIIDDKISIIGSHNWGYSAFERNNEASILVNDERIAEYYKNYFEGIWKNS